MSNKIIKPIGKPIGNIVYIDEKQMNINYNGVEGKGPRPYLFVNKCYLKNASYMIPITDQFKENGEKKSNDNWLEINLEKPSYLKLDSVVKISISKTSKGIKSGSIQIKEKLTKEQLNQVKAKYKEISKK